METIKSGHEYYRSFTETLLSYLLIMVEIKIFELFFAILK
jgi:hypothetical protein